MKYLLDTDTVTRVGRGDSQALLARFGAAASDQLALSAVTRGEIEFGLLVRQPKRDTMERMRGLLLQIPTLPLTTQVAAQYSMIRAHLCAAGKPIGFSDLWIAAHALSEKLIMVTGNERQFRHVPGLKTENWLT